MDLREARFRKRLSQWGLTIKTGISQSKISLIERQYVIPNDDEKQKIAQALGYSPDQIAWESVGADVHG